MYDPALVEGVLAMPGTFLAALPPLARERLLADAVFIEIPSGGTIFSPIEALDRTGVILRGMARTHLSSTDGRRLSVHFARPGAVIGSLIDGRSALSVHAVGPCVILELSVGRLRELIAEDGRVGLALVSEVSRRLRDTYATLAGNTFGSMRERVARHLLDLATETSDSPYLVASVTQQSLADCVGTVREVVARVLREFRSEGIVATTDGRIEIVDPGALAAIVGRARSSDQTAAAVG